ncbi:MAG: DUF86 domain-containing protein [Deltaproteobacteria bacterium]|nr:DUF86 domain-containing protein [Deltaproteobacteria bacterium]
MSKRAPSAFVADIKRAIRNIQAYAKDMDYPAFLEDRKTQDAVVRNLEIIGEASKNVPEALRQRHPDVPWSDLAKVRDKLIHHYFGVNLEIVWGIATESLPLVLKNLQRAGRRRQAASS